MFSNNFKIAFIFQCIIIHFYLTHFRIFSNLYLTLDSVCNCTLIYTNIQVRRRIGTKRILVRCRLASCSGVRKLEYSTPNILNILLNLNIGLICLSSKFKQFYTIFCMFLLLLISVGDIELNRSPRKNNTSYNFPFCHWNLSSMAAHNFSKLSLLEAYNVQHKFDMIYFILDFLFQLMVRG